MENEKDKPGVNSGNGRKETISELADRHLHDQNHTTTDEELRNATVEDDTTVPNLEGSLHEVDNTTVIPPLPGEAEDDNVNESDNEDKKDKYTPPNPYDVLG